MVLSELKRLLQELLLSNLVAINTRKTPNNLMTYLLQYDSVYRIFNKTVKEKPDRISVNGKKILTLLNDRPENIPWEKYEINAIVAEDKKDKN